MQQKLFLHLILFFIKYFLSVCEEETPVEKGEASLHDDALQKSIVSNTLGLMSWSKQELAHIMFCLWCKDSYWPSADQLSTLKL